MIMATRTATPPTTPPTMGPIGVEPFFLLLVKLPPSLVSPKPGPEVAMDVTSSVAILVADVKVTEAALVVVDLTPALVVAPVECHVSSVIWRHCREIGSPASGVVM